MRTFISLIVSTFVSTLALAQTGNFTSKISFNGEERVVAWHVPDGYDDSKSYRLMVGLHGLGDNATNYRNSIINSLKWNTLFPNTIFAFPDGGADQNSDFYAPEGDEAFIDETIKSAIGSYNITNGRVILQGFSLGGSSALQYGLDHTNKFEALLLNTPAVQGYSTAANILGRGFAYENASDLPIFITHGEDDALYTPSINESVRRLKTNGGKVQYILMKGVGHRLPSTTIMNQVLPFFDQPAAQSYDVDLFELQLPSRSCSDQVAAHILVQNRGQEVVTSLDMIPIIDGQDQATVNWTGTLKPFETVSIPFSITSSQGDHEVGIRVNNINANQPDQESANNERSQSIYLVPGNGQTPDFMEGFEGDSEAWLLNESKTIFQWFQDEDVSKSGSFSLGNFNTILIFNTLGNVEYFESPVVDLSSISNPGVTFDLSYNYHRYTPPYFTDTVNITDTLEVQISTDCGTTYETIYRKWGQALATTDEPIVNPLQVADCFFAPEDNEWRNEGISLEKYKSAKNATIRFNYISGLGGSINIDNIQFGSNLDAPKKVSVPFDVFPNPANTYVQVELGGQRIQHVQLTNTLGQIVLDNRLDKPTGNYRLNTTNLEVGMYNVSIVDEGGNRYVQKVMLQH
ncbi:MAG: T9SS type A sorting domain-containing protein [Bacteroidia bacterium]|nr:T9SS type A sorting domain-containing protein [Bacteroidia bacterium]